MIIAQSWSYLKGEKEKKTWSCKRTNFDFICTRWVRSEKMYRSLSTIKKTHLQERDCGRLEVASERPRSARFNDIQLHDMKWHLMTSHDMTTWHDMNSKWNIFFHSDSEAKQWLQFGWLSSRITEKVYKRSSFPNLSCSKKISFITTFWLALVKERRNSSSDSKTNSDKELTKKQYSRNSGKISYGSGILEGLTSTYMQVGTVFTDCGKTIFISVICEINWRILWHEFASFRSLFRPL